MKRRAVLCAAGAALAWPFRGRAQQSQRPLRIGFLSSFSVSGGKDIVSCFGQGLEELGWIDKRNINIEYRWAESREDRFAILATELAGLDLDLIACNSTLAAQALQRATMTIPVVFMSVSDPVASGIVKSLARPGANVTGVSNSTPDTAAKLLELLKLTVPEAARVSVLFFPDPGKELDFTEITTAAKSMGIQVDAVRVRTREDINNAFADMAKVRPDALIVTFGPATLANREWIIALAAQNRLPAIYQSRVFIDAGGLMSYGLNACQHYRHAATYVDKILKGAKPADLPVELPTTFELLINSKAAKALSLKVPPILLARADEVIE
jgi:putative ABC transport system substrate-binding protein